MKFFKYWLPLLTWSGVIFYLSSLPAGAPLVRLMDFISSYLGHFLEYTVLCLLSFRAFENSFSRQGVKNVVYSGSLCGLYALSDEIHQAFVPTRYCSVLDVLVDFGGIIFAFFLVFIWRRYLIY